ncbi:MAG: hypothetical protein WBX25_30385, partial [Rhodomicrobium sp.]
MTKPAGQAALFILLILAVWEAVGLFTRFGIAVFPPPTEIVSAFWEDRGLYLLHGAATARTAALGFVAGT